MSLGKRDPFCLYCGARPPGRDGDLPPNWLRAYDRPAGTMFPEVLICPGCQGFEEKQG